MLRYLVILLDDTSTSFCHYDVPSRQHRLISIDDLKKGILFAMKQGLQIQFVYPDYEIPDEWKKEIATVDHCKIMPVTMADESADIVIVDNWDLERAIHLQKPTTIRVSKNEFFKNSAKLIPLISAVPNLNVVFRDVDTFDDPDYQTYESVLNALSEELKDLYIKGETPLINLLTDRMVLSSMNNCNAGDSTITLAPDGQFYVCPAFYYEPTKEYIGDLEKGVEIKNQRLYSIRYAPICRHCDAYQCKRCVWLNKRLTHEVNTPSREQCISAHIERNASRRLLYAIREHGEFLPDKEISEIDYLDPFEKRSEW